MQKRRRSALYSQKLYYLRGTLMQQNHSPATKRKYVSFRLDVYIDVHLLQLLVYVARTYATRFAGVSFASEDMYVLCTTPHVQH